MQDTDFSTIPSLQLYSIKSFTEAFATMRFFVEILPSRENVSSYWSLTSNDLGRNAVTF